MRCLIAYNPTAGRYPSRILVERAGRVFEKHGWQVELEQTRGSEHITALAEEAAKSGLDTFIMAGGDGSLNRAIAGLLGSKTALGVLPAGTANVWAQELGLPGLSWTRWLSLEESARRLATARVKMVDIGICNKRPFLLWAGVGLDGFVVNRIEPRRRWEKHFAVLQYVASIAWHATFWHGMNLKVEVDNEQISGHFLLSLVSNVHLYAGGIASISPSARLDDGEMDLWLFEGENLGDVFQQALSILAGNHATSERVHHLSFRQLRMESESRMYVQLDGEPEEGDGFVVISVKPQALRMLIPETTPLPLFKGEPILP